MRLLALPLLALALACGGTDSGAAPATDTAVADTAAPPKDTAAPPKDTVTPPAEDTTAPLDMAEDVAEDVAPPPGDVLVNCPLDKASPNGSKAQAWVLSTDMEGLTVCKGADDWYRLDLAPGHEMQVQACTQKGTSAVDVAFFREEFEQPGAYMGGGSSSPSETCEGTALWEAPGTYFFHVSTLAEEAAYSLDVHLGTWYQEPCKTEGAPCSTTAVCTGGFCACKKDALEPNDTPQAAALLPLDKDHELVACVADDDWLEVEAKDGDTLAIHMETSALVGQGYFVSLAVFAAIDPSAELAFFPKATYSEDYTFAVPAAGTYLLRVRNVNSNGRSYTIRVAAK